MPFINEILKYKSVSVIGMEKNTGKTECLNYILSRLRNNSKQVAITSIGIDGEQKDIVFKTEKPEIEIFKGMIFVTTELHYKERKITSEILNISTKCTSLGRLITARAIDNGKVIISGPPDTVELKHLISEMQNYAVDLTLVDGALSRMTLASPAVTQAMVLATGAAYSANISNLVQQTKYVYDLINIDSISDILCAKLGSVKRGIWGIDNENNIHDLEISSTFTLDKNHQDIFRFGNTIYVAGVVNEKFLNMLKVQSKSKNMTLIMNDFSKMFATPATYYSFLKKGNTIKVVDKAKLIAICVNPISPSGYNLNSDELQEALKQKLNTPVYDVRKIDFSNQI